MATSLNQDDLDQLRYSRVLLENPLRYDHPYADEVGITARLSFSNKGRTSYLDINDNTPTAVSCDLGQCLSSGFGVAAISKKDVVAGTTATSGLVRVGAGALMGISAFNCPDLHYVLFQRDKYRNGDPNQGYLESPLAINHMSGACGEIPSVTMVKELQEEVRLCVRKKPESGQVEGDIFDVARGPVYPLTLRLNGNIGLMDEANDRFCGGPLATFLNGQKVDPTLVLDIDDMTENFAPNSVTRVITRVNGQVFDETKGFLFFDQAHSTVNVSKILHLHVPKQYFISNIIRCEPRLSEEIILAGLSDLEGAPICLVPVCDGIMYCDLPTKEELWDRYYMEAPVQLRS